MDYNIPSYISPLTILRASRLARNAESIGIPAGNVYWTKTGDNVYFMFTSERSELIIVHCCPYGYFVEKYTEEDSGYAMVKNVRHLVFWLRKSGYYNCEHLKEDNDDAGKKEAD